VCRFTYHTLAGSKSSACTQNKHCLWGICTEDVGSVRPSASTQVQLDIRQGHAQTVDKVLAWFDEEGGVAGTPVCDCGCGTGSLAIPLALRVRAGRVLGIHADEGSM